LNGFVTADFEKISGIVPFKFSIHNLKIGNIFVDSTSVVLNKNLTKIKNVSVQTIDIKTSADELNFDISKCVPLLIQKVVESIDVNNVIYNNKNLGTLKINRIQQLNSTNISLNKLFISAKASDKVLLIDTAYENYSAQISYHLGTKNISSIIQNKNTEILKINGVLENWQLKGIINLPNFSKCIGVDVSLRDLSIRANFENISANCQYDTENKQILVKSMAVGEKISIKPFTIEEDLKVREINILLPSKGEIKIKNVDFKNFNLGVWKFTNVDIFTFNEDIKGILNGISTFEKGEEHFDLMAKNIECWGFKIPSINIKGIYGKNKINAKILYSLLQKINSINIEAKPKDWLIDRNTIGNISAKGIFKIDRADFKGNLQYNISAKGSLRAPHCSGTMSLKDGIYINSSAGIYLKNGTVNAIIKNNSLIVDNIYATDDLKKRGEINGQGKIYQKNGDFYVDVGININSLHVIEMREFNGKLFGKLSVSGNLSKEIKIKGDLYSNNAVFDVSNFIRLASYSVEIADSINPPQKSIKKDKTSVNIPIDVNFKFVPNLKITGFGIDSTWCGGAHIYGSLSDPHYEFLINLQNGIINVTGRKFTITNGTITCSDKTNGAVMVDVSATKKVEHMTMGVRFIQHSKGTDVSFFSNPYTSKNNVLSYLLFEKPASDISSGEAITLITVMGKLSGKGGFDIMDKIKTVFGLDMIEIKKNNNTSTGGQHNLISIGKSLGKVKVSLDQGTEKDTTKVVVESDIAANTKINVDMTGKNNFGAGVAWHKRY
jgi:hypothetical protein